MVICKGGLWHHLVVSEMQKKIPATFDFFIIIWAANLSFFSCQCKVAVQMMKTNSCRQGLAVRVHIAATKLDIIRDHRAAL